MIPCTPSNSSPTTATVSERSVGAPGARRGSLQTHRPSPEGRSLSGSPLTTYTIQTSFKPDTDEASRPMPSPALSAPKGIYVCVGTRQPVKLGYTWRMWWGRTSFYLKPRSSLVGGFKISLHGPDRRHPRPGFKIALDGEPPPEDKVWMEVTDDFLPRWFPGEPSREAASRVVRLRWTSELFAPDIPSGPPAGSVGTGFVGTLAEPPPPGFATDIDLIVAKHARITARTRRT
jgi:hypothetical protein